MKVAVHRESGGRYLVLMSSRTEERLIFWTHKSHDASVVCAFIGHHPTSHRALWKANAHRKVEL